MTIYYDIVSYSTKKDYYQLLAQHIYCRKKFFPQFIGQIICVMSSLDAQHNFITLHDYSH